MTYDSEEGEMRQPLGWSTGREMRSEKGKVMDIECFCYHLLLEISILAIHNDT